MENISVCDFSNVYSVNFEELISQVRNLSVSDEVFLFRNGQLSNDYAHSHSPEVAKWLQLNRAVKKKSARLAMNATWTEIDRSFYLKNAKDRGLDDSQMNVRMKLSEKFSSCFVKCLLCGVETLDTDKLNSFDDCDYEEAFMDIEGFKYFHTDTCACNYALKRFEIAGLESFLLDDIALDFASASILSGSKYLL